ncbi:hypothetical protein GCG21_11410 [Pseudactinotalea sp. HY160]|uniref:PGAP1-like alpha/beta domain-containing protein n=1 Tax=Pseudactinotalea sp. HY160 TaxID=2654490 RepID=UPI00128CF662|nr:hypothetical protein [Pseudactinotalea sp. HY160]MPV50600.1 hypothetical protein [Pseudactinotalea sp. HY160]
MPDDHGGLIVYGAPIGTSAYGVDTELVHRRAGQIDEVVARLATVTASLQRARAILTPRAHLAPGGSTVLAALSEACGRILAHRHEAAKIASSARIAVARYEWAEAAARARIPGPGVFGLRGPLVPNPIRPLRVISERMHSPELDHAPWAQAGRILFPGGGRLDPAAMLPGPLLPFGHVLGLAEGVVGGQAEGMAMGQVHPGGAGSGKILREVTRAVFPFHPDPEAQAARTVALALGPSTTVAVREWTGPAAAPVSTVAGAVAAIQPLYPGSGGVSGQFRIDKLTAPDGSVAWEVFVPGSQDGISLTNPLSWRNNPAALIGMDSAATRMVLTGMRRAGVGPTDPVVIAGHSQGGMVAVNVANHPEARNFNIAGVITAGSPISDLAAPDAQTLALEHTEDPVPGLDDDSNSVEPGMVTVERSLHESADPLDRAITDARGSHDLPAYLRTAERVDASDDPLLGGVKDLLEEIAPAGVAVETRYFQGVEWAG